MPSEVETIAREFLDWFLGNDVWTSPERRERLVRDFLVDRAHRAMGEGVPRYVPVDGHDWHDGPADAVEDRSKPAHEESPATMPRGDRAPGAQEGSIAPTG